MSAWPLSHLFGIGAKLATCVGCGMAAHHIDRPSIGIMAAAALLVPLAWSLEDMIQLFPKRQQSARRGGADVRSMAIRYQPASSLPHPGLAR